ncbi:MAG: hypothetical protein ABSG04_11030, partial [Verrucomicrobiota bacterium]
SFTIGFILCQFAHHCELLSINHSCRITGKSGAGAIQDEDGRISVFGRVGALRRPGRRSAASLPRNCPRTEMRLKKAEALVPH